MAKPSDLPVWNTDATNRAEPTVGRQAAGFSTSDTPTSLELNWWFNLVYEWTAYVDDLVSNAFTWVALHTFQAGIVVTQSTSNGTAITATANGTGAGVIGTATASAGSYGVKAVSTTETALKAESTTGKAVYAVATGAGATAIEASSTSGAGNGVKSTVGSGVAIRGVTSSGGGIAIKGEGSNAAYAGSFVAGGTTGFGVIMSGSGERAPLRLIPQTEPTQRDTGDLYVNSGDGKLYIWNGAAWVVVGTQS